MDPGRLTNVSVVYPNVQHEETGCVSLKPLLLTVCFSGMLPEELLRGNIPIQIPVSIAEEYGMFTTAVVNTMSMDTRDPDDSQANPLPSSDMSAYIADHGDNSPPPDDSIPFLLFPPTFDSCNRGNWSSLWKDIKVWLVLEVDPESLLWAWGHDAFWLAFIGTYPYFLRGRWPMWDSQVLLQDTFIEGWLDQLSGAEGNWIGMQGTIEVLNHVWAEFCMLAALFYPGPLISSDSIQDD
ncbi:hypothetical protein BDR07DRAFT_1272824 [Suillus spraguei]|nr:hypothetical protein BDR07DRAFT_1272824 [Suillus spraguei]